MNIREKCLQIFEPRGALALFEIARFNSELRTFFSVEELLRYFRNAKVGKNYQLARFIFEAIIQHDTFVCDKDTLIQYCDLLNLDTSWSLRDVFANVKAVQLDVENKDIIEILERGQD